MKSSIQVLAGISILGLILGLPSQRTTNAAAATAPAVDPKVFHHVDHIGWIVKDLDSVLAYWKKLGLRDIHDDGIREFPDTTYRGKKTPLRLRMAFASFGNGSIEWIQPVQGTSVYNEFLKQHGDGVQHLAYLVTSPEEMTKQVSYFKSRGVEVVQSGSWKGTKGEGKFAYLDTAARGGGINIELCYNPDVTPGAGSTESHNLYPLNHLTQYAFVVRDVKKVSDYYAGLVFDAMSVDHNVSVDRNYRGKPGIFEMYLGWWRFGDITYEWIQSLKGSSVYDEFLQAHGEGLHHLAFAVRDMDEATKLMASRGAPVSQSGGWDNPGSKGRFAYLDAEPHGGVTIELLWDAPRKK